MRRLRDLSVPRNQGPGYKLSLDAIDVFHLSNLRINRGNLSAMRLGCALGVQVNLKMRPLLVALSPAGCQSHDVVSGGFLLLLLPGSCVLDQLACPGPCLLNIQDRPPWCLALSRSVIGFVNPNALLGNGRGTSTGLITTGIQVARCDPFNIAGSQSPDNPGEFEFEINKATSIRRGPVLY